MGVFNLCAEQVRLLTCVVGLEALLPYLRIIPIMSKWERDTAPVGRETRSDPTRRTVKKTVLAGFCVRTGTINGRCLPV